MMSVLLPRAGSPPVDKPENSRAQALNALCGDEYPRYPAGKYEAACHNAKVVWNPLLKAWKCQLLFELMPGGEPIFGFYHLGREQHPHIGRNSEYYRAWVIANGDTPRKRQHMSERVFRGKIFEVEVADVRRRYDQTDHPPPMIYSTVRRILRRVYP